MKKIFLGPPGSGKGTYSSRISPILNIPHISTGDLIRDEINKSTELGKKAKEYYDAGKLVPDEFILNLFKQRIEQPDCKNGFILDGFPRTIPQAQALQKITNLDVVTNLVIPEEILIEKACSRRICKNCGDIYNISNINRCGVRMPPMNPKEKGKCDKCGGEIIQRADDNEQTIKDRLEIYKKETQPLIDFYKNLGILKDIKITSPPNEMVPIILEIIKEIDEEFN